MDYHFFDCLLQALLPSPPPKIAIAVSGGSDSMALLCLMKEWATVHKTNLYPLIVNHGLRPEAFQEAMCVQHWIKTMGLSSEILHWSPSPTPSSGIMEKARHARYELLALACHRQGISHLCVAHHLDDVLETVWMRERQGSPWRGLAGISSIAFRYGIHLVRPLLTVPQLQIQTYLKEKGIPWINDPSNSNPLFLRTHARKAITHLSPQDRTALLNRTRTYAHRRQEETHSLSHLYDVQTQDNFLVIPEYKNLTTLHPEQGGIILESWIYSFTCHTLKRAQLENLWKILAHDLIKEKSNYPKVLITGGGCLFIRYKESLYIFRESSRIKNAPSKGRKEWIWDHRFFCYGIETVNTTLPFSGPWIEKYSRSSLPQEWPNKNILFRWCRPPYPHFTAP